MQGVSGSDFNASNTQITVATFIQMFGVRFIHVRVLYTKMYGIHNVISHTSLANLALS